MKRIFLGLGSNVGDRKLNIETAIEFLKEKIKVKKVAGYYLSKAVGYENQEDFLNTALEGFTDLSPYELLEFVKSIEKKVGRIYRFHWGPREIDIDILFYDEFIVNEENLKIPHPEMHKRDFVVLPMMDLDAEFTHPVLGKKIKDIFEDLNEKSVYRKL